MELKHGLVVVILLAAGNSAEAADVMRVLAVGFIKVLEECKHELNIGDGLITDLYRYWKQEFDLMSRETGCAIICMSKKLDLLREDGSMHHGNAKEFAMKNGAADDIATKIISVIHECEKKHEAIEDDCSRVLEVAKCFRVGIHQIHWEPQVDVIVTEILTEI